ncbi:transposase (plasmid) [Streptomyces sp. NBC_01455]|nr:transposase [Streptomyces sp. NBC_01455]
MADKDEAAASVAGDEMVGEVVERLLDKADASGAALLGEGGLLTEITRAVVERALEAEMSEHLGYERGDRAALDSFEASDLGQRYPAIVRTWRSAWPEFTPYLAFPPAIRMVVYSPNMVESINSRLRKATRNRGHFPSEQAALKVLYLAVREQINPKARDANHVAAHWKEALNQFSLFFEDRLSIQ